MEQPRYLPVQLSRRKLLKGAAGAGLSLAGAVAVAGCSRLADPGRPVRGAAATTARGTSLETTTIRLGKSPAICYAPQYVAEDLLRAEGFADVQYVDTAAGDIITALASGEIQMNMNTAGIPIMHADADESTVMLAGIHVGCFELFAATAIRTIGDLRGKRVAVTGERSGRHIHLAAMAAYVGIDPNREITWVFDGPADAIRQLAEGQVDAFMAFPPEPQELRARNVGHVVANTNTDRPWSHYFCCLLVANRAFVQNHPVATKSAMRAILKGADICASQPERAAENVVGRGYTGDYGYALQSLKYVPYDRWREYDPEDTVRFYALRLQEAGMIKSGPNDIIARGTNWRFLNELKQELKG
jgi:NitT/TauT family transport system substrate-binding protein